MLKVVPLEAYEDNYIWAIHLPDEQRIVVVDPGDADRVERYLLAHNLELAAMLVTHHHADHTQGLQLLLARHRVPVYGPSLSAIPGVNRVVHDNTSIDIGGLTFSVLATPGHTLDHLIYFLAGQQPALFCGDLLFSGGCGRLFEGSAAQMFESIQKIKALPTHTLIYPAHEYTLANLRFATAVEPGNSALAQYLEACQTARSQHQPTLPVTLAHELRINPFLRTDSPTVIRAAANYRPEPLTTETDTFAALRAWKDSF